MIGELGVFHGERRVVGRFGDPRKALGECKVVLGETAYEPEKVSFVVEYGKSLADVNAGIHMQVREGSLSAARAALRDLVVLLLMRDRGFKRFVVLDQWSLDTLPDVLRLTDYPESAVQMVDDVEVGLALVSVADETFGTTIARKNFEFVLEQMGSEFPHQPLEADKFESELKLPRTTPWFLHLFPDADYTKPPEQCFLVYINKDIAAVNRSSAADAVWCLMGAEVLTHVLLEFYSAGSADDYPPRSLGARLQQIGGLVEKKSRGLIRLGPDADVNRVHAVMHTIVRSLTSVRRIRS